jgi:DNA-binding NtrC family response regulator
VTTVNNLLKTVLLVDDEENILTTTRLFLQGQGIDTILTVSDSRKVLPLLAERSVEVIVLDLHMPYVSGQELLPVIVENFPQIPVILVTANDDIDTVVTSMKSGAFDYLVKPVELPRLAASIRKALERNELSNELDSMKQSLLTGELKHPEAFAAIVTNNRDMKALFQYLEVVAPTRQPILVTGETGVGKELVAQAIHSLHGGKGEFVALNVAGLDDSMFTDTLFGHKKGAFSGAEQAREGMISRASGGTLFLDEIGDLSESSQIKLLRLLQGMEYYPVGSDTARKSDARVILATNRNLPQLIATGKFRNDLFYRVCAHQISIPPLRERLDDLPLLLDTFLETAAKTFNKKKPTYPRELVTLLSLYSFPGNIRQLEALVHDAVARHGSGILSMESFRKMVGLEHPSLKEETTFLLPGENALAGIFGHFPTIREVEEYMIAEAMRMAQGNQGIAATLLGLARQTLNKRLK